MVSVGWMPHRCRLQWCLVFAMESAEYLDARMLGRCCVIFLLGWFNRFQMYPVRPVIGVRSWQYAGFQSAVEGVKIRRGAGVFGWNPGQEWLVGVVLVAALDDCAHGCWISALA
jgi:hypothetical protein